MVTAKSFASLPRFTANAGYHVQHDWNYLIDQIRRWMYPNDGLCALDIDPDFQRAHVWTEAQQISYVEYILKNGLSGRELYFNCPGWQGDYRGPFVLVDGKQRLNAALRFLNSEIPAFGQLYRDYPDRIPNHCWFSVNINNLKTRREVLQWYLDLNTGGTPHTVEEIEKVMSFLANEQDQTLSNVLT